MDFKIVNIHGVLWMLFNNSDDGYLYKVRVEQITEQIDYDAYYDEDFDDEDPKYQVSKEEICVRR